MGARLRTFDDAGGLLVDSNYICLGLVKSGYMESLDSVQRYMQLYANSTQVGYYNKYDPIHGFSVRAVAPLVFVSGQSVFVGQTRVDDIVTFRFGGASTSVRYWVFDLMANRGSGAKLRLRSEDGAVTYDSDQIPLQIIGQQIPTLPTSSTFYNQPYSGGSTTASGSGGSTTVYGRWSIAVPGVADAAVNLPWSRGAGHNEYGRRGALFSALEGAYGSGGSVFFMFMTEPGGFYNPYYPDLERTWLNVPTNRRPSAAIIDAAGLPFPYDITGG